MTGGIDKQHTHTHAKKKIMKKFKAAEVKLE